MSASALLEALHAWYAVYANPPVRHLDISGQDWSYNNREDPEFRAAIRVADATLAAAYRAAGPGARINPSHQHMTLDATSEYTCEFPSCVSCGGCTEEGGRRADDGPICGDCADRRHYAALDAAEVTR